MSRKRTAKQSQVCGSHYREMAIQTAELCHRNGIPFIDVSVIKYVCRWRAKNGIEDLRKARHFLDILIEMEESMSRTKKGSKGHGYEYWKSRLHKHGETPGRVTKKLTHKAERRKAKKEIQKP